MTDEPTSLDLLRSLVDPLRLAVAGAAVGGPVSIDAVVSQTGRDRKDVARAVGDLVGAGILDADGSISGGALAAIGRDLPRPGHDGDPVSGPWSEREADVLGRFFDGDRLVRLPASASKRRLVLEKIAIGFEPGRRYPERDVNFRIQLIHADYAAVRRYLVDEGFMDRADGAYWRTGGRYEPPKSDDPGPSKETIPTSMSGVGLRPYDWTMADALVAAADDPRIPMYMGDMFASPYTAEAAEAWLEMAVTDPPHTQFAIFDGESLVGGCGGFLDDGEATGCAEIGWWLNPERWGRGITTAAVGELIASCFEDLGQMRLWAPVMAPNVASARVAEKCGMAFEGVSPGRYLKRGVRYDAHNYGLTRAQWHARRSLG